MSSPLGHPDWQSYAQWRGPTYSDRSQPIPTSSNLVLGPFVTSHYASLYLNVSGATVGTTVSVTFGAVPDNLKAFKTLSWDIRSTDTLEVLVPIVSNYVWITVASDGIAGRSVFVHAFPTNVAVPRVQYPSVKNLIRAVTQSVPANGSITYNLPQVMEGPASLCIDPVGTANQLTALVTMTDMNNVNIAVVYETFHVAGIVNAQFQAPAGPLKVQVLNDDVAAHNVDIFVMVNGGN